MPTANLREVSANAAPAQTCFQRVPGNEEHAIQTGNNQIVYENRQLGQIAAASLPRLEIQTVPVLALTAIDRRSHDEQQRTEEEQHDPSLARRVKRAHSASPPLAPPACRIATLSSPRWGPREVSQDAFRTLGGCLKQPVGYRF